MPSARDLHARARCRSASPRSRGAAGRASLTTVPSRIGSGRSARLGVAPGGADVVVAADVAERSVERIGHERQVVRLEVAGADDQVDLPDPLAAWRLSRASGRARPRHGEDADRSSVRAGERPGVGPAHARADRSLRCSPRHRARSRRETSSIGVALLEPARACATLSRLPHLVGADQRAGIQRRLAGLASRPGSGAA